MAKVDSLLKNSRSNKSVRQIGSRRRVTTTKTLQQRCVEPATELGSGQRGVFQQAGVFSEVELPRFTEFCELLPLVSVLQRRRVPSKDRVFSSCVHTSVLVRLHGARVKGAHPNSRCRLAEGEPLSRLKLGTTGCGYLGPSTTPKLTGKWGQGLTQPERHTRRAWMSAPSVTKMPWHTSS